MPIITPRGRGMGWRPSPPDFRDVQHRPALAPTPPSADLRPLMPPIYDQGSIGSCTGNAVAAAVAYDRMRQRLDPFTPSRLFVYYNARALEGTARQDVGATIRDAASVPAHLGVCSEDGPEYPHIRGRWVYDPARVTARPGLDAYFAAAHHRAGSPRAVAQDLATLRATLASGLPICIGIAVYQSFESQQADQTGDIPMPQPTEDLLGGHAVLLVGYDDAMGRFRFRNSWGLWGDQGYGTLPYDYVLNPNLAGDFWVLSSVFNAPQPVAAPAPGVVVSTGTSGTSGLMPNVIITYGNQGVYQHPMPAAPDAMQPAKE